jgi:hypothetical protein
MTAVDYLDALLDGDSVKLIGAEFAESLSDLGNVLQRAIKNRELLLQLQQTRLVVTAPSGSVVGPEFFSSILSPGKWMGFAKRLVDLEQLITTKLAA